MSLLIDGHLSSCRLGVHVLQYDTSSDSECDTTYVPSTNDYHFETQALLGSPDESLHRRYMASSPSKAPLY